MSRLLVCIPDRITDILVKGEFQPNYYNPGELFDEVHILMTNDDQPDLAALQRTVGRARLFTHNWPDDLSLVDRKHGWLTPFRLRAWAKGGVEIARKIAPQLVRCHGADWNTYLASRIKAALDVPYVVSLHINPDINPVRRIVGHSLTVEQERHNRFYDYLERAALRHADLVMPVYRPILPYLDRIGVKRAEVCYNILNGEYLRQKADYRLHDPVRIISVGRVFERKNPKPIIDAVASLTRPATLTIVGDGSTRAELERYVHEQRLERVVTFRPAVPNDELCAMLPEFDLFAIHSEYWEISKSLLEALLTGLPCIVSRRRGDPVPELQGDFVRLVENTTAAYRAVLQELISDDDARAALGQRAYRQAQENWSPARTEAKMVAIYKSLMRERVRA
jgi:glycosyltransferase involved in cell wall biosynthesis